jgi:dolichol-phosphate mannosyltransferase
MSKLKYSTAIVIPTFNEVDNIKLVIDQLSEDVPEARIIVIDDNSTDGTLEQLLEMKSAESIELIVRTNGKGFASACIAGYESAIQKKFERIVQMDADGSHRVIDLLRMLKTADENGLNFTIVGSRWMDGGKTVGWDRRRYFISKNANKLVRIVLQPHLCDQTSGFKIYPSKFLANVNFHSIRSKGYAFQIEMLRQCSDFGSEFIEVPIVFVEREFGISKFNRQIIMEAAANVIRWTLIDVKKFFKNLNPLFRSRASNVI